MKKLIKYIFWIGLAVAGIYYGVGFYNKVNQKQWPAFEQIAEAPANAPEVATVSERDYGWRIGDIVPAEFYVMQKPGTVVDPYSFSTEGSFAIIGEPKIEYTRFEDGTTYIHIKLKLQSMSIGKSLSLKSYMLYRDLETNQDHLFPLPEFKIFTSQTWDGRDIVKVGDNTLDDRSLMVNTLLMIGIAISLVVALRFLNQHLRQRFFIADLPADFNSRKKKARIEFDAIYERIINGDFSDENFLKVALIIRELFHLQTAGYSEITAKLGEAHPFRQPVTRILLLLGEPLYRNRVLSREEVVKLKEHFDFIVPPTADA